MFSVKRKIETSLAEITFFHTTKYRAWKESICAPTHHMHSFNDSQVAQLCKGESNVGLWMTFNENHLSRIYPSGLRYNSSNFSPLLAWSAGCQLVC